MCTARRRLCESRVHDHHTCRKEAGDEGSRVLVEHDAVVRHPSVASRRKEVFHAGGMRCVRERQLRISAVVAVIQQWRAYIHRTRRHVLRVGQGRARLDGEWQHYRSMRCHHQRRSRASRRVPHVPSARILVAMVGMSAQWHLFLRSTSHECKIRSSRGKVHLVLRA